MTTMPLVGAGADHLVTTGLGDRLAEAMDAHDARHAADFPHVAWALLAEPGLPAATADGALPVAAEQELVRAVARADVSLGRLVDGHLNAVQRLVVQVDPRLARHELDAVRRSELRLGVWGADPASGEGEPARLREATAGVWMLDGVKTFCSGAGGLHRAFVLARGPADDAPLRLAYVDLTSGTTVDPDWFGGAGMRGSASHRVRFDGAPVLWIAPQPGALLAQPWFAQDGLRTAASWAGGADRVVEDTIGALRAKGADGDLEGLAVSRLLGARRAIDLWLAAGAQAVTDEREDLADEVLLAREAIATAVRAILDESSRVLGSRPFSTGGRIERARRDLQTYLLQHRLEPMLARTGRRVLRDPES